MKELRIKDICDKGSSNLKQKDVEGQNGSYPVYGASGIISHISTYHQKDNYIAIVKDGSGIGRVTFMPAKSSVIGTMQYILPQKGFNINYIGYCLMSLDLTKYKQGAAIPHIYFKDYGERKVNVTEDIDEQESIVSYLDNSFAKIDQLKAKAAKAVGEAKALFRSTLKELMTPKENCVFYFLSDIAEDFSRGKSKHRPRNDKKLFNGNYPFIQTGDVRNADKYVFCHTTTYNDFGLSQRKLWPKGTICITIAANIAETAILNYPCCFPDSIIGMIPDKTKVNEDFIYYLLLHYKEELKKMGKGSAQDNINLGTFEKKKFPIPPLSEQVLVVDKLNKIQDLILRLQQIHTTILAECDAFKRAILKQVFE